MDRHDISMTIGVARRPSVMALIDGTVKPEGIDLTCIYKFPEPSTINRHDAILEGKLDGGECSTAFFVEAKVNNGAPLQAIPVFPYRSFRHRSIYCGDWAGIKTPADLKGKKVGVHMYAASTMTWVRGFLRDEYGVRPQDINWYTIRDDGSEGARQAGVSIEVIAPPDRDVGYNQYIAQLVVGKELHVAVGPVNVVQPGLSRLFPNFAEVESAYYSRTGIFPIIHTTVINERIVRDHPWVPRNLLEAYRKAAELTPHYAADPSRLESGDREVWEVDRLILGEDSPYEWVLGPKQRHTIEAFLDYLMTDGVIALKPTVESLFARL